MIKNIFNLFKSELSNEQGLADLLNYAHLVEDGIILNKDGAYVISYKFRGQDVNSSTASDLDALTANFNRMLTFLGDGWMIHIDEVRVPSMSYPKQGYFPDSVSSLIDDERRELYESEGSHYENLQFLTFVWKFPMPVIKTAKKFFVEGLQKEDSEENLSTLLKKFIGTVERCIGLVSTQIFAERLNSKDLLSFLNTCITGELLPVTPPPDNCYVDVVLGRREVIGGYVPKIGNKHLYVLNMLGYQNDQTLPSMLEELASYPLIYRWSNRFIVLNEGTAEREIKKYEKNWSNKVKGIAVLVKEIFSGKESGKFNAAALTMKHDSQEALQANASKITRFGYWTSNVVLMHEDIDTLEEATKTISKYLEQKGFTCIKETVNAMDAWRGTIPGHGSCNVRRLFVNGINLAHVLPLNSIWVGNEFSSSASLLPNKSPPVFYGATLGKTPFRYHIDVSDVGHQMVIGRTGAGKSTFISFLAAQFLRYKNAQVFIFDKDYSHLGTTVALEGHHYDIGNAEEMTFCPLADLSSESKRVRAEQFIEDLVILQNVEMTPQIKMAIHDAIESLSAPEHVNSRNLTIFKSEVQNEVVRAAIKFYTIEGRIKMMDALTDCMQAGHMNTFEMGWLLSQKPEIYIPVLRYIFDQIESRLEEANGKNPTLIILEEAWLYLAHKLFAEKIKDWLKTLRKKNARVIFVTQSLADVYDPESMKLTSVTAAILESCFTRVYLPNPGADKNAIELYRMMNLNERQIQIITQEAIEKRNYYVVTQEGNRLIDLGFSDIKPMALSFIGMGKEKSISLIEYKSKFGVEWVYYWLTDLGFSEWAEYWKEKYLINKEAIV